MSQNHYLVSCVTKKKKNCYCPVLHNLNIQKDKLRFIDSIRDYQKKVKVHTAFTISAVY